MSTRYYSFFAPPNERTPGKTRRAEVPHRKRPKGARLPQSAISTVPTLEAETIRRPINLDQSVQTPAHLSSTERVTARDLMKRCAATLRPEDSIERAAGLMNETQGGLVPVVDGAGRLIGIITDRDITLKLVASGASIPHTQVGDCMTAGFACSVDSSLEGCVSAMAWHRLTQIPLVDEEHRIVGTISRSDLACYVCENPQRVEHDAMADILLALAF